MIDRHESNNLKHIDADEIMTEKFLHLFHHNVSQSYSKTKLTKNINNSVYNRPIKSYSMLLKHVLTYGDETLIDLWTSKEAFSSAHKKFLRCRKNHIYSDLRRWRAGTLRDNICKLLFEFYSMSESTRLIKLNQIFGYNDVERGKLFKAVCTKSDASRFSMKIKILGGLINHLFVFGKSKMLVTNAIKNNMWEFLELIHNISPIKASDIKIRKMSDSTIKKIRELGISLTDDLKSLFTLNDTETIIDHLNHTNKRRYVRYLKYVKDDTLIEYMVKNDLIGTSKKDVRTYHKKCLLCILHYLVSHDIVKINSLDIRAIFKKTSKTKSPKKRSRRYRYPIPGLSYRREYINCNPKIKSRQFNDYIRDYLKLTHDRGIDIKITTDVISALIVQKQYNTLLDMYERDQSCIKHIDNQTSTQIYKHAVINDDIDMFKKILDLKLIKIEDIHHNKKYVNIAMKWNAHKILDYIMIDLHVKCIDNDISYLWNWIYLKTKKDKIMLEKLKLMKKYDVPLNESFLTRALRYKVPESIIIFLCTEYGLKVNRGQLPLLAGYSDKLFKKLSENIQYNKKSVIYSFVKRKTYAYGIIQMTVFYNLIKRLTDRERQTVVSKCMAYSLIKRRDGIYDKLREKYDMKSDIDILKRYENKPFKGGITDILKYSIRKNHMNKDIESLKDHFTKDRIYEMVKSELYKIPKSFYLADIIKYYDFHFDYDILCNILSFNNNYDIQYSDEFIDNICCVIERIPAVKNGDADILKQLCKKLLLFVINDQIKIKLISRINGKDNKLFRYLDIKMIYEFILNYYTSKDLIVKVLKQISGNKDIRFSPYLYTILDLKTERSKHGYDFFYTCPQVKLFTKKYSDIFFKLCPKITQEDYDKISKRSKYFAGLNFEIIEYEPDASEIPESFEQEKHDVKMACERIRRGEEYNRNLARRRNNPRQLLLDVEDLTGVNNEEDLRHEMEMALQKAATNVDTNDIIDDVDRLDTDELSDNLDDIDLEEGIKGEVNIVNVKNIIEKVKKSNKNNKDVKKNYVKIVQK